MPEPSAPQLPLLWEADDERAALVALWCRLTREVLPGMAERCGWPVSRDHCFMRVCLDAALGAPWPTVVRRPAIRHLSTEQLAAAVAVAQALVVAPETLNALNRRSIRGRREARIDRG